jgi:glyoxylate reductase
MKKIYITRQIPEIAIKMLREKFEVEVYEGRGVIPRNVLLQNIKDKDAVLTLLTDKVDAEFFKAAGPYLKIVANYAVGYDNIDIDEAKKRNIVITNTPGVLNDSVAEFTLALIMTLSKRIVEADKFVREHKYKGWEPMLLLGM